MIRVNLIGNRFNAIEKALPVGALVRDVQSRSSSLFNNPLAQRRHFGRLSLDRLSVFEAGGPPYLCR